MCPTGARGWLCSVAKGLVRRHVNHTQISHRRKLPTVIIDYNELVLTQHSS
jgi:hypothetical protein